MAAQTAFDSATLQADGGGTASFSGRRKRVSRHRPYHSSSTYRSPERRRSELEQPSCSRGHYIGTDVALGFEMNDASKTDLSRGRSPAGRAILQDGTGGTGEKEPMPATVQRCRNLSATLETALRCGKASTMLTRAGKILVGGAYPLGRSSGMNRVTGVSVHIN